jgi:hypothetical protein
MDLSKNIIGKDYFLIMKNGFYHRGIIKDVSPTHILIIDNRKGECLFSIDEVKSFVPSKEKNGVE